MIKGFVIIFLIFFFNVAMSAEVGNTGHVIELDSGWTFKRRDTGELFPVPVGFNLADQFPSGECCSGSYFNKIEAQKVRTIIHSLSIPLVALYVPAIGGVPQFFLNGNRVDIDDRDYSTIGPILYIPAELFANGDINLEIRVDGPRTTFAGLWKNKPLIGSRFHLEEIRKSSLFWQSTIPWVSAVLLSFFSIVFLWIYFQTNRRFHSYLRFSYALIAWATFFLFLSGIPRDYNYYLGAILLYPSRIIAGFGLFLLIAVHANMRDRILHLWSGVFLTVSVVQIVFAVLGMPTAQKVFVVLSGPISMVPLFYINFRSNNALAKCVIGLTLIALIGQTLDAIKLIDRLLGIQWTLPYLNRVTIVPLLLTSIIFFIRQFAEYFHKLREESFRSRGVARFAFSQASRDSSEDDLKSIIKSIRRTFLSRRCSIATKNGDGRYQIVAVDGVSTSALGNLLDINSHRHIEFAIRNGAIQIENSKFSRSELWVTNSCLAVPIPLKAEPEFVLLLSDPIKKSAYEESDIPHLSQIASSIWISIEKRRQSNLRVEAETKFRTLLEKIDPNLYEYIKDTLSHSPGNELSVSPNRAIGFFDQKLFTALLERLSHQQARLLVNETAQWVGKAAFRYGGRIKAFYGDAFILETINLGNESQEKTVIRLISILWELQDTIPILNQKLLSLQLEPINFRFGAHYGVAEELNVAFIDRSHQTLIGDSVNVAARVQGEARAGEIYVTELVARLADSNFEFEKVSRKFLRNREGEVQLYKVTGKRQIQSHQNREVG